MANPPQNSGEDEAAAWGTWDELLLACAVKRHGFKAWDSVASEVQSRTSLPLPLTTPLHCELKYQDLQRRFTAAAENDFGDKVEAVPWLDELRRRRVAELRQDVQRHDVSILSLQLKVKKLEDEREESLREDHQQPDRPEESKPGRSDHDKLAAAAETAGASAPEKTAAKSAAGGEESDRENRSVNGSNSTGLKSEHEKAGREGDAKGEEEEDRAGSEKADQASEEESKPEGADSYNGSSEPNRERRGEESDELRDSVGQSKENSSDVQSSASLTRRKKRKGRRVNEISCDGGEKVLDSYDDKLAAGEESQPLLDILKLVMAHKHSSFFERRLAAVQESDKYHNIIRQHIDMDTIQSRLRKGSYSSSPLAFYRDLLILFDNALVFYPKSSPESVAALDLHRLISSELRKKTAQTTTTSTNSTQDHPPLRPKPELERSDSLLAKHKSSTPIIVCRKRSSFSAKSSPTATSQKGEPPSDGKRAASDSKQQPQPRPQPQPSKEHQNLMKIDSTNTVEKSVTGARSLRRSNTNLKISNAASPSTTTKKTTPLGSSDKTETPRADQKKSEGPAESTKKRSAADFLKRIKRNSPSGKSKNIAVDSKNSKGGGGGDQKKKQCGKGGDKGEERASRQSGGNSGVKQAKEDSSPSKRSVGRPPKKGVDQNVVGGKRNRDTGGGKEAAATTLKQPRKRTKR